MAEEERIEAVSKAVADELVRLLEAPNERWLFSEYTAKHVRSGTQIWTGNSILFVNTYPVPCRFGPLDKWRIWRALGVAQENAVLGTLSEP